MSDVQGEEDAARLKQEQDGTRQEEAEADAEGPAPSGEDDETQPDEEPADRESELEQQVQDLEGRILHLKDQLLRAVAEQENLRKRAEREREQTRRFGITSFARDLLSAADNLRRALDAAPDDREAADEAVRNLVVGVEMTERDLLAAFERNGIRRIDPAGEQFDYNFHQAMFEVTDSGKEPGTIVQVLQPGYLIGDRLLRAAMVGVAKAPPEPEAEEEEPAEG